MESITKVVGLSLLASCLSGCSIWSAKYGPEKPHISYVLPQSSVKDRIYVWNPNTTAAYISETGGFCISSADVYKTRSIEADAGLKASVIQGIEGLDASAKTKLIESVTKLSEKDAAGTFLSVALFNICMIAQNRNLTSEQTFALITQAMETSSSLGRSHESEKQ